MLGETQARRRGTSPGRTAATSPTSTTATPAASSSSKRVRWWHLGIFIILITIVWIVVLLPPADDRQITPQRDDRILHATTTATNGNDGSNGMRISEGHPDNRNALTRLSNTLDRQTAHVSTDKPIYRMGETIYWRASIFDAFSRAAPRECQSWRLEIKSPKGDIVHSDYIRAESLPSSAPTPASSSSLSTAPPTSPSIILPSDDSPSSNTNTNNNNQDVCVLGGSYVIPTEGWSGGEYTLRLSNGPAAATIRKIQIRGANFRTPRLNTRIDFVKKGYGAGEEAMATVHVRRIEGGIPKGATVTAAAIIDGIETWSLGDAKLPLSDDGHTVIQFKLPQEMLRGEGTLNVIVEDGGIVESAAKTIPILLQTLDIAIYPEGGQLIAGVPNTVYIEAHTPTGDPADIAAHVVYKRLVSLEHDKDTPSTQVLTESDIVATVETIHEGRASFTFTPTRPIQGESYELVFLRPNGLKAVPLPDIMDHGIAMTVMEPLRTHTQSLKLQMGVASRGTSVLGKYKVNVYHREREVLSYAITIDEPSSVAMRVIELPIDTLPSTVVGVLRITVIDFTNDMPVAERLIYRPPASELDVHTYLGKGDTQSCDQLLTATPPTAFAPGDRVKLCVRVTDAATKKPIESVVGITVSDHALTETIEKRRQPLRLQSMVWLEDEVKELFDSSSYFTPVNNAPSSDDDTHTDISSSSSLVSSSPIQNINLLLATQGWRRFAYGDIATFKRNHPDYASRVIAEVDRAVHYRDYPYGGGRLSGRGGLVDGVMNMMMPRAEMMAARAVPLAMPMMAAAPPQAEEVAMHRMMDDGADAAAPLPPAQPADYEDDDEVDHDEAWEPIAAPAPAPVPPPAAPVVDGGEAAAAAAPAIMADVAPQAMRMIMPRAKKMYIPQVSAPVLRVYAHQLKPNRQPNVRNDFTDTVYWNAGLRTNQHGHGEVSFTLSDSITSFHVYADAFAALKNGIFGSSDHIIVSREPYYIETKLPAEISSSDKPIVPVIIINASPYMLSSVTSAAVIQPANSSAVLSVGPNNGILPSLSSSPDSRSRQLIELHAIHRAGAEAGEQNGVRITSKANGHDNNGNPVTYKDSVIRNVHVVPDGFPVGADHGGMIDNKNDVSWTFELDDSMVVNTANVSVRVYPSPAANLLQALAALIREPYGCFEQTSSTTYPLVMAQQYFKTHSGVDPELIRRSDEQLQAGYKRLIGYETKEKGFEWFGSTPAHEALTAYGLLQFIDMSKVMDVDQAMVQRTRDWLISRKNTDGSAFLRSSAAIDSFGRAPDDITNAYIVWSLTYAGETDLVPAIDALIAQAKSSRDPYFIGLVAGILYNVKRNDEAMTFADQLINYMADDGSVSRASTSITGSSGDSLLIETTSISILTWMNNDEKYAGYVERGMRWLASRCKDGKFGSTQGTVLALKAIVSYDLKKSSESRAAGALQLYIDDHRIGNEIPFDKSSTDVLNLPDVSPSLLSAGRHTITLKMVGGSSLAYSMSVRYYSSQPQSSSKAVLQFSTKLSKTELNEGSATQIVATISNNGAGAKDVSMTTAIIGIPGGLELRHDQLRELVTTRAISFYEIIGRDLVIYWRGMAANAQQTLHIDVTAAIPGYFTGPASRAYVYYDDEHKAWSSPLSVTIAPKLS